MNIWTWPCAPDYCRFQNEKLLAITGRIGSIALSIEWADEAACGNAMQIVTHWRRKGKPCSICLHASPGHHDIDLRTKTKQVCEWIQAANADNMRDPIGSVFLDCELDKLNGDPSQDLHIVSSKNEWREAVVSGFADASRFSPPIYWFGRGVVESAIPTRWATTGWFSFVESNEPNYFSTAWYKQGDIGQCRDLVKANMQFASMMTADNYKLQLWIAAGCGYRNDKWHDRLDLGDVADDALFALGQQSSSPWYCGQDRFVNFARIKDVIIYKGPDHGPAWDRHVDAFLKGAGR